MTRWRDPAGKHREKSFTRKRDAQDWAIKIEDARRTGAYADPSAGRVTFRAFADQWLAAQSFDPSTREIVERRLRLHALPSLGDRSLHSIKPSVIQGWLAGLSDLSDSTRKAVYAHVSAVLGAAVDDEVIAKNPCQSRSVRRPKVEARKVIPWTPEQVAAILAGMPDEYRIAGLLAAGCGLRQGEVFGLAPEDIDRESGRINVRRQVRVVGARRVFSPPKGGKSRSVPLPASVSKALAAHVLRRPVTEVTLPWEAKDGKPVTVPLVLTNSAGSACIRDGFNRSAWWPALAAAGIDREGDDDTGMHALRHFYASVLLDAGESIKAVSEYLGHHDPGFTLRTYTHLMAGSDERTRKAIDAALSVGESQPGDSEAR